MYSKMSFKESNEYKKAIKIFQEIIARERDIYNANENNIEMKKFAIALLKEWIMEAFADNEFIEENPLDSGLDNIFKSQSDTQASK